MQGWPEPYIYGVCAVFLAGKSKCMVIYGAYIRFWTTLDMCVAFFASLPSLPSLPSLLCKTAHAKPVRFFCSMVHEVPCTLRVHKGGDRNPLPRFLANATQALFGQTQNVHRLCML